MFHTMYTMYIWHIQSKHRMNDIDLTSIESRPSEFLHSSPPKNQSSTPAAMRSAWQSLYLLLDTSRHHWRHGTNCLEGRGIVAVVLHRAGLTWPPRAVSARQNLAECDSRTSLPWRRWREVDLPKCKLRRQYIAANLAYHAHHTLHT